MYCGNGCKAASDPLLARYAFAPLLSSPEEPRSDELLDDERLPLRPLVDFVRPRLLADTLERGGTEPSESEALPPRYAPTLLSLRLCRPP